MADLDTLLDAAFADVGLNIAQKRKAREYVPLPWQVAAWEDTDSQVILLTGSAGGGKSRLAGEILHRFLMDGDTPATGLMMRKAREWCLTSIIPFMRQTVIRGEANVRRGGLQFDYANRSALYVGGMKNDDQREAIRSIGGDGALDVCWFEEANAFSEEDFNEILGRMRGKARGRTLIILSTNPDAPNHWINRRLIGGGEATIYYSGAKDNPHNPTEYIQTLEKMTGLQYQRLVLGHWVMAEGAIFDNFSTDANVTREAQYRPGRRIIWGVDDGYAAGRGVGDASYHPRVFLVGQETAQGGVDIFYEYYKTSELSEASLGKVLRVHREHDWPLPDVAYVDSSAVELKARIWEAGIMSAGATHPVYEGIKNVRRLVRDGQGMTLLRIHPRCQQLIQEMQSYRYDTDSKVANVGEPKPLKVDDHGCDSLRYMTWHLRYES